MSCASLTLSRYEHGVKEGKPTFDDRMERVVYECFRGQRTRTDQKISNGLLISMVC